MKSAYSEAFVEQARVKVLSRGDRTIRSIADELNMNHYTLKNWMKKVPGEQRSASSSKEKWPQDWCSRIHIVPQRSVFNAIARRRVDTEWPRATG